METPQPSVGFTGHPAGTLRPRPARGQPLLLACLSICLGEPWPALATMSSVVDARDFNIAHREAACILVVHRASDDPWPDATTLSSLLQTSAVADAPAREVLGINPELRAQKVRFQINATQQDRAGDLLLNVRILFDMPEEDETGPTRAYLAVVIERFRDALGDLLKDRSARLEQEISSNSEEVGRTEREIAMKRDALAALDKTIGMHFATPQELRAEPSRIRFEITSTMNFLESYRWQSDAAGSSAANETQPRGAWQKVVDLREARLPELQRLAADGKVDPVEVAEFEARLEEARARVSAPIRGIGPMSAFGAPKMAADKMEETERLLERLTNLEKLDLRGLATKWEILEAEQRRLIQRQDALGEQVEKTRLQLKGLSTVSVEVIGK